MLIYHILYHTFPKYQLEKWVANVDVTLTDGTIIKAGDPITSKQIAMVVVNQDIEFTAINEKKPHRSPILVIPLKKMVELD